MMNETLMKKNQYRPDLSEKVRNFFLTNGFYFLCLIVILVFTCINATFFSVKNLFQVLTASSFLFATAAGVTVVIITGNMDLSVGSVALLCASIMFVVSNAGASALVTLIFGLLTGLIVGLINGLLVSYLKMNSMILTLGLLIGYRGLGLKLINGTQVPVPAEFKVFGKLKFGDLYAIVIVCFILIIILHILLTRTRFGKYCYAIGCTEVGAKRVGIPVNKVKIAAFMISGFCAAVAGCIIAARLGLVHSYIGKNMEFNAIEAAVIGGVSLAGGRGKLLPGTLFGVLLIYMINNGLSIIGASEFVYPFAQGIIVFAAMYMDALKNFKRS
jgi:inositol transport system permease protein